METSIKKTDLTPEQLEAQRQYKETKENFRAGIKELVAEQKKYKYTIKNTLGQVQSTAQSLAAHNGQNLRHHYIAYAQFRGKQVIGKLERNPADASNRNPFYQPVVDKILENYGAPKGKTVRYNS